MKQSFNIGRTRVLREIEWSTLFVMPNVLFTVTQLTLNNLENPKNL